MKLKLNALGLLVILLLALISCRFIKCKNPLKEGLTGKKSESRKLSADGGLRNPYVPSYGKTEIEPGQTLDDYNKVLAKGIKKSDIPEGDEDLYILKSEVIPPVCPACPVNASCPREKKCPPCPACARCPEPAFECKKVPNFRANSNPYLPKPILADFSQFGM